MESNEQTELTRTVGTDSQMQGRTTVGVGGPQGEEGLSRKEKGLVDMDNSAVITGGRGCEGTKWQ